MCSSDLEGRQGLVEHLAVLGCGTRPNHEYIRAGLQGSHDRGHLDGLGPGAEDDEDAENHDLSATNDTLARVA